MRGFFATAMTSPRRIKMEDYFFELPLSNARTLCLGTLTRREADTADADFCDGLGTYLYLANADAPTDEVEVIAKVVSTEAAERLRAALLGRFLPQAAKATISSKLHT
jgi:hypothetical protein